MGFRYIISIQLCFILVTQVLLFVTGIQPSISTTGAGSLYRGKYIGRITPRQHKVSGEVYAVDARTLHIRGFSYSGSGPDAFFWTGFTEHPSPQGVIVPNEKGTKDVLGAYNNEDITITLPDGLTLRDIKWFGVWCRAYEVNFGDLYIPSDLDFPQPHVIGSLSGQHGVSSGPIVVVDAQTILVPDFSYDGQAPDVHFWVGKGKPGPDGTRVADETGIESPLAKSDKKTMVLSLPDDLTIFDIDYFGVYCKLYYVDFGHVKVPNNLNVPPSLKMLGVTPQTKLNCEVLHDRLSLEVRWATAGDSIVIQLIGKIDDDQYMSFGLSGDDSRSVMIGGDVVVGWYDRNIMRGNVIDYYLDSKSQCSGRSGACPDSRLKAEANNVRLLSASLVNGYTMLTFQRPLRAHDELDKTIPTNASQSVIWAVGPINQRHEVSYHSYRNRDDLFIDFGRVPKWNCPAPEEVVPSTTLPTTTAAPIVSKPPVSFQVRPEQRPVSAGSSTGIEVPSEDIPKKINKFKVPQIKCDEPDDRVYYAQMGPTGGKQGYSAITGKVGWGIAWYLNGLLVPEIYVVRGKSYTFVIEGGDNPDIPAKYHPFYITDDPEGAYGNKSPEEKRKVRVFAGHGGTATGRLCQWQENPNQLADSFTSYGAYQRSLTLQCDEGHPGILHWTVGPETPDTVYYQCYSHRYLGWKIHVVDSCGDDKDPHYAAASNIHLTNIGGELIYNDSTSHDNIPETNNNLGNGSIVIPKDPKVINVTTTASTTTSTTTTIEPLIIKDIPISHAEKQHLIGPPLQPVPFPEPAIVSPPQAIYHRQDPLNSGSQQVIFYPQNSYVQFSQLRPSLAESYTSGLYSNIPYPNTLSDNRFVRKDGQGHPYTFMDASEHYVVPTRSPVAYPLRYERLQTPAAQNAEMKYIIPSDLRHRPIWPLGTGERTAAHRSSLVPKRDELRPYEIEVKTMPVPASPERVLDNLNRNPVEVIALTNFNSTLRQPNLPIYHTISSSFPGTTITEAKQALPTNGATRRSGEERDDEMTRNNYSVKKLPEYVIQRMSHPFYQPVSQNLMTKQYAQERRGYRSDPPVTADESNPEGFSEKSFPEGTRHYPGVNYVRPPSILRTFHPSSPGTIRKIYQHQPSQATGMASKAETQHLRPSRGQNFDTAGNSKLEISPSDDITMVYMKGAEDQLIRREIPKILEIIEKKSNQRSETRSEESNESQKQTQVIKPISRQKLTSNPKHKNSTTDLHILTDIWSIINNQDETSYSNNGQDQTHLMPSARANQKLEFRQRRKSPAYPVLPTQKAK